MTEERYKKYKLILLTVFVVGALAIGGKISQSVWQLAENGRYIQYDRQKDSVTTGNSTKGYTTYVIDTRTGAAQPSIQPAKE